MDNVLACESLAAPFADESDPIRDWNLHHTGGKGYTYTKP